MKMDPKHCLLLLLAHPKLRFRKNNRAEYRTVRYGARTFLLAAFFNHPVFFALDGYAK